MMQDGQFQINILHAARLQWKQSRSNLQQGSCNCNALPLAS